MESSSPEQEGGIPVFKITKKERNKLRRQKLEALHKSHDSMVPRVCIDLSLGNLMSEREMGSLACQIRQVYGANRRADKPMQVWLTSLDTEGAIYKALVEKNDGFEHYVMNKSSQHCSAIFPMEDVVYLTPDSQNILTELQAGIVYIIGGLVDESVLANVTFDLAQENGFKTAKLPLLRYLKHGEKGTFSPVLAVNQVFDILLRYYNTGDWESSVLAAVPKRKGFILR